jgi:hypothetical protein
MKKRIRLIPEQTRAGGLLGNPFHCDRPEIHLELLTNYGFVRARFRVDSAADLLTIPIRYADREGIPFSKQHPGTAGTLSGQVPCYYDYVTVKSVLSGKTYRWPCCFLQSGPERLLLGRACFLQEFGFAILDGELIILHIGPIHRWLRRLWGNILARISSFRRDPIDEQTPAL